MNHEWVTLGGIDEQVHMWRFHGPYLPSQYDGWPSQAIAQALGDRTIKYGWWHVSRTWRRHNNYTSLAGFDCLGLQTTDRRFDRLGPQNPLCRRFDPGGSLDRRVNCRCVSQPRWVGARRNTRGKREPRLVLSFAQGGCACSRGLQAFTREGESLLVSPSSRTATFSYEGPGVQWRV
jgi:hypothetical protein